MNLHAFDSETPQGNMAIIADENKCIEAKTFKDFLKFVSRYSERKSSFLMFNLRFDSQAIIKTLSKSIWNKLWDNERVKFTIWDNEKEVNETWDISYLSGVTFTLRRLTGGMGWNGYPASDKVIQFFDIAKFYQGYSLDRASKEFLNENKDDRVDSQLVGESKEYYNNNIELIKEYCLKDAQLTYRLGLLMKKQIESLNMSFNTPYSAAAVGGKYQLSKNTPFYPRTPESIKWMEDIAAEAYHGGMFQTLQRGLLECELFDYDINSAYPSSMTNLPNWVNGRFITMEDKNDVIDYKPDYGWYLCDFDCKWIPYDSGVAWTFSDIINGVENISTAKNNRIYYPDGLRRGIVTKLEYDFMKKHGYKANFLGGIGWYRDPEKKQLDNPFNWVGELYTERAKIKKTNNALQYTMKIIMNGVYGKTVQKVGNSKLRNYFYGSYITADTRVKLAEVSERNKGKVVNIATDGIVLTKEQPDLPVSKLLGEWEGNIYDKGLFIGSGIYQVWKKGESLFYPSLLEMGNFNDQWLINHWNFNTKARGITGYRDWDMLKAIRKNRFNSEIVFTKKRPIQMGEVLAHTKILKNRDLNRFKTVSRRLTVNTDISHHWNPEYTNFKDLLDNVSYAIPYSVGELEKNSNKTEGAQKTLNEYN